MWTRRPRKPSEGPRRLYMESECAVAEEAPGGRASVHHENFFPWSWKRLLSAPLLNREKRSDWLIR